MNEVRDVDEIKEIVFNCYVFSIIDEMTGEAIAFKAKTPAGEDDPHWVFEMGADRDTFLGTVFERDRFRLSTKSPAADYPAVALFTRLWDQCGLGGEVVNLHVTLDHVPNAPPVPTPVASKTNDYAEVVKRLDTIIADLAFLKSEIKSASNLPF
jgi:hypothetical protein